MCVSQKSIFLEFLLFQKNMFVFQSRFSTEKKNTVLSSNNTLRYPIQRLLYSKKRAFLTKAFREIHTLSKNVTILKVKLLQRKGSLFSLLAILWHIPNNSFYFLSNKCPFLTKAFHEILTFKRTWLSLN